VNEITLLARTLMPMELILVTGAHLQNYFASAAK